MRLISRRSALAASLLAFPAQALARQSGGPIIVPIQLSQGRILTSVTLAGRGPYDFVIDTGGVIGGIREDLAMELKLKRLADLDLRGGGGSDNFAAYEADEVVVGGAYRQDSMILFGLKTGAALGGDGLLAGVATKVDTDFDFPARQMRLYPNGRGPRDGFTRLGSDIRMMDGRGSNGAPKIVADVELDGVTRRMLVDTGAPRGLTLAPQVSAASGLWNDARPYAPLVLKGIAGLKRLHGRMVRARGLKIGGLALEAPLVALNDPGMGRGQSGYDGIIGLPLLRRLDLSTDIAGSSLWVRPNGLPIPPESYNRSGLWLDQAGSRVVVTDVGPGSPAAEAGILVGDRLAASAVLGQVTSNFTRPAGDAFTLDLERDGKPVSVTLTLRDYL